MSSRSPGHVTPRNAPQPRDDGRNSFRGSEGFFESNTKMSAANSRDQLASRLGSDPNAGESSADRVEQQGTFLGPFCLGLCAPSQHVIKLFASKQVMIIPFGPFCPKTGDDCTVILLVARKYANDRQIPDD